MRDAGLGFERPVALNGYRWWYLDALSDDRRSNLTLIAFVGSVFSPYYASARRRGAADPNDFCAVNLALHTRRAHLWTMTERRRDETVRAVDSLIIGPSRIDWAIDRLTFQVEEVTCPLPRPVRGRVVFTPFCRSERRIALDEQQRHVWMPLAPRGHVEVELQEPSVKWHGSGYLDSNEGDAPLEDAFIGWHWSRAQLDDGTAILYDIKPRGADWRTLALHFDHTGKARDFAPPPACQLPKSRWNIIRSTRSDDAKATRVGQTLLDAPFYVRSVVNARLLGQPATAVHESLDLDRFRARLVQTMLRFRVARPLRLGYRRSG